MILALPRRSPREVICRCTFMDCCHRCRRAGECTANQRQRASNPVVVLVLKRLSEDDGGHDFKFAIVVLRCEGLIVLSDRVRRPSAEFSAWLPANNGEQRHISVSVDRRSDRFDGGP